MEPGDSMVEGGGPGGPWTLQRLEEAFPSVPWRQPVKVTVLVPPDTVPAVDEARSLSVLVCRVCVANDGLKAQDIIERRVDFWTDPVAFAGHLRIRHGT